MRECALLAPDEPARVLAGGLDRLELSLYLRWESTAWFEELAKAKREAQARNEAAPITIEGPDGPIAFSVQTTGAEGHEWIIRSKHYSLSVGNWSEPKQRPSVSLIIHAETLWHLGTQAAVVRIVEMLRSLGAHVEAIKVSRLDACVDILLRESDWRRDIEDGLVTRARDIKTNTQHRKLTGFSIGKNDIAARLYDKPTEIVAKSRKVWMYDIWGIDAVPNEHRVIRVEFQLRREKIKGLGVDTLDQLEGRLPGIWSYCTRKWCRVAEVGVRHKTQETLRAWWSIVQNGFPGAQDAEPLVVVRAVNADRVLVARQALGCLATLAALDVKAALGPDDVLPMQHMLRGALREAVKLVGWDDHEFSRRVRAKQAKRWRHDGASASARVSCGDSSMEG